MSDRRFKRKLTPFICQELLYDYVVGALDAERRQAVDDFLPTDAETQRRLASIKIGFVYAERLSKFEINPSVLRRLNEAETVLQMGQRQLANSKLSEKISARVKITPATARGLAVGFSVVLILIAGSLIPWRSLVKHRAHGNAVELAAIQNEKKSASDSPGDSMSTDQPETPSTEVATADGSGDDEGDAGTSAADESGDEGVPQTLAAAPAPLAIDVQVPVMNVAASAAAPSPGHSRGETAADDSANDKKDVAAKGFVYRAFMTLDNVEDVADDITHKIESLGGEKAGEVELGWKKAEGRYYHFAMPEANQEKLLSQLRAYGPVRISKDPHPRVMPKGRVRIILWVDETKPDT